MTGQLGKLKAGVGREPGPHSLSCFLLATDGSYRAVGAHLSSISSEQLARGPFLYFPSRRSPM